MRLNEILTILSIIFIIFLIIGNANASDVNSTVLNDADSQKTFESIQTDINNTSEYGTIALEGNYSGTGTAVTIDKPVTIEGSKNGATLDAKSSSQAFIIKADNVVLKNLNIINGNPKDPSGNDFGGGINIAGNNVKIIDCNFSSNYGRYGG